MLGNANYFQLLKCLESRSKKKFKDSLLYQHLNFRIENEVQAINTPIIENNYILLPQISLGAYRKDVQSDYCVSILPKSEATYDPNYTYRTYGSYSAIRDVLETELGDDFIYLSSQYLDDNIYRYSGNWYQSGVALNQTLRGLNNLQYVIDFGTVINSDITRTTTVRKLNLEGGYDTTVTTSTFQDIGGSARHNVKYSGGVLSEETIVTEEVTTIIDEDKIPFIDSVKFVFRLESFETGTPSFYTYDYDVKTLPSTSTTYNVVAPVPTPIDTGSKTEELTFNRSVQKNIQFSSIDAILDAIGNPYV